jgi:acetylxylan esterase
MLRLRYYVPILLAASLSSAPAAQAATNQKVAQSDWWAGITGFPSYVNMYIYVPDKLASKPPIVVVPHHCQGTASSSYSESSSLISIADKNGFILIFPEATGQNCWDAGSTRSLNHEGKGDTGAVVQMVKYTLAKYSGDAGRVYSVGGSSGGIMTEALLGVYPDVFMAGVSLMGVPCGCWSVNYHDVTGKPSDGTGQWSGDCAGGKVVKTAQQWGDLVRSYFPGYTGHRPRLQHWHGTTDTTLDYKNMAEDIKEWTNLLGLSDAPTGTDTPKSGTTHQFWKSACGYTVYETFALSGVGHAVPFDGNAVAVYFGLDKVSAQDPETAACPDAIPGQAGGGAGGASGSGGSTGTAGAGGGTGAGGAGPGADAGAGVRDARTDGLPSATGGVTGNGGSPGESGGTMGSTGGAAGGGAQGSGGAKAGGAGGEAIASGGSATGGASAAAGSGGRTAGSGGMNGHGGDSGSGTVPSGNEPSSGGCACALGQHTNPIGGALALLGLMLFGGVSARRRRRR